jgi:hypothetical protein
VHIYITLYTYITLCIIHVHSCANIQARSSVNAVTCCICCSRSIAVVTAQNVSCRCSCSFELISCCRCFSRLISCCSYCSKLIFCCSLCSKLISCCRGCNSQITNRCSCCSRTTASCSRCSSIAFSRSSLTVCSSLTKLNSCYIWCSTVR